MKQVLCLDSLLDEQADDANRNISVKTVQQQLQEPKYTAALPSFVDEERSRAHGDQASQSPRFFENPPQKNTFIHFDIPMDDLPPTPTSSAPGVLLRRLFRTKSDPLIKTDSGSIMDPPASRDILTKGESLSPTKYIGDEAFEQDSDASTSARGSVEESTIEVSPAEVSDFALTAASANMELHSTGQCTPCNYFWYKVDGCRQGADCSFCHLCPKGEIKKRKKDKLRQLRWAGVVRR